MHLILDPLLTAHAAMLDAIGAAWDVVDIVPAPVIIGALFILTGAGAIAAHNR